MENYINNMSNAELRMAFGDPDRLGYKGLQPGSNPWMKYLIPGAIILGCLAIAVITTPSFKQKKRK